MTVYHYSENIRIYSEKGQIIVIIRKSNGIAVFKTESLDIAYTIAILCISDIYKIRINEIKLHITDRGIVNGNRMVNEVFIQRKLVTEQNENGNYVRMI